MVRLQNILTSWVTLLLLRALRLVTLMEQRGLLFDEFNNTTGFADIKISCITGTDKFIKI